MQALRGLRNSILNTGHAAGNRTHGTPSTDIGDKPVVKAIEFGLRDHRGEALALLFKPACRLSFTAI